MLHLVEPQRVYPPETTAAMTAAFERLCASIPKSVNGDDLRRQLALIILRHSRPRCAGLGAAIRNSVPRTCRPQRLGALANRSRFPPEIWRERAVPITSFLNGVRFDRETTRIMGVAFEMTRVALGIAERRDDINEIVAKTIVELTKQGERNPDLLCERALQSLREQYL